MNHSISFVIVAGGTGQRMQSAIPKQFLNINGHPIFVYSIQKVLSTFPSAQILLVLPPDFVEVGQSIVNSYFDLEKVSLQICVGGATRYHSVANGLALAKGAYVMVHDAVRPLINQELLENLYQDVQIYGNAIPAVDAIDSMRMIEGDENFALDRSKIKLIQTPQAFLTEKLKEAYASGYQPHFTDDASVLEYYGAHIHLTQGHHYNMKITTPMDLVIAETLLKINH